MTNPPHQTETNLRNQTKHKSSNFCRFICGTQQMRQDHKNVGHIGHTSWIKPAFQNEKKNLVLITAEVGLK